MKRQHSVDALVAMHRGPVVSACALEATLKYVRDNGLPTAISRRSQQRARAEVAHAETPYGPVLQALRLTLPGIVFDTFCGERKHKGPKRFARLGLRLTQGYNKMLMEEMVCQHFHDWAEDPVIAGGLVGKQPLAKATRDALQKVWPTATCIEQSCEYRAASQLCIYIYIDIYHA